MRESVLRNVEASNGTKVSQGAGVLLLLLCAVFVSAAVTARANNSSATQPRRGEQTSFGLEEPVRRQATLPEDVLRGLGQDERVQGCLTGAANAPVEIPASWFAASAINLNGDRLPDLVVKPENSCLFGANIGPFWVFRNTGHGYALALRADALNLEILPTKTRGFRNIRTKAASARQVFTRIFRFDGQSYQPARR